MKIIYLTSSMATTDFDNLTLKLDYKPNPSNQNFHHSLIKALSMYNNVDVLSALPIPRKATKRLFFKIKENTENDAKYTYLPFINITYMKMIFNQFALLRKLNKIYQRNKQFVIIVDSLNYPFVQTALRFSKKRNIPVVGIFTDNPQNMASVTPQYVKRITKTFPNYDLYLSLTKDLNDLVNIYNRPYFIFEGLVDEETFPSSEGLLDNYFFFAGAIYQKYGILNMLEAFQKYTGPEKLVIAGQGPDVDKVKKAALEDSRIHYLGLLPSATIKNFEANSLANLNPRIFDRNLDRYSIPSKVIEYASSGTPTITTFHTALQNVFHDSLLYIGHGNVKDIYNGLVDFAEMDKKTVKEKALSAKRIAINNYSLRVKGLEITHFIKSNISFSI